LYLLRQATTTAVFKLTARNDVAETNESPLEIGETENGRQGQDAMDGGLRRTETGCRVSPCRGLEFVGERSAKHRFRCGAAGIAKGVTADPLCPFTGEETTCSAEHKVNGTQLDLN